MKDKRALLFRAGAVLILIAIAALMMVIGRGHTIYFDNKAMDYQGQTYETPYKVVVVVKGEQAAKLYDGERGMATCIGQSFKATLEVTQTKGGQEVTQQYTIALPYNLDGVVINLPAFLAGLPQDVYMSEFVPMVVEEEVEEIVTDEFGLSGME